MLPAQAQNYDLVILNGRVMDPETRLDAVRNVGVKDGKIAVITKDNIKGAETINAKGHVVSPGFIDTHFHAIDPLGEKLGLRDGVTTAMDLEAGAINIAKWYAALEGKRATNYGTTVSHMLNRMLVHDEADIEAQDRFDFDGPIDFLAMTRLVNITAADGTPGWSVSRSNPEQLNRINAALDEDLRQGALGLGSTTGYMRTGVTTYELYLAQKAAARYGRLTGIHARFYPSALTPIEHPTGFNEVFTNAVTLGAPLIYQHNCDYGWWEIEQKLAAARAQGLNMWSECYPYVGASTAISAEFFMPDVYEAGGNAYGSSAEEGGIYSPAKDKFYTKEEFLQARKDDPGEFVVAYYSIRAPWLLEWLKTPHMTIASDAVVGAPGSTFDTPYEEYAGHPRTTGTRGKAFRLARENDIPLMHMIANASYYPALHLGDAGLASMKVRGRMQEGMVADITIFDPEKITDNATYKAGEQGRPTTGIPYVIVNGTVVVKDSKVQRVYPGQPIRYPVEEKGRFEPITEEDFLKQFPKKFLSTTDG
jgi:cytosine/adenosine deaminase-related metal-dependent hydrolase